MYIVFLLFLTFTIDGYVQSASKCCSANHYLHYDNETNFTCLPVPKGLHLSYEVNLKVGPRGGQCFDVLVQQNTERLAVVDLTSRHYAEISEASLYPKCCPLNKVYDTEERRCVPGNHPSIPIAFYKIGLSSCVSSWKLAIVDYTKFNKTSGTIVLEGGIEVAHGKYCLDVSAKTSEEVLRVCEQYDNVCKSSFESKGAACFAKCCPDGHIYVNGPKCTPTFDRGINLWHSARFKDLNLSETNFGIIPIDYQDMYEATREHVFYIDKWGAMHVKKYDHWFKFSSNQASYCIETVKTKTKIRQAFFLIVRKQSTEITIYTHRVYVLATIMIVSMTFLFLSIVCFSLLPERRTLYGSSLLMYFVMRMGFYGAFVYSKLFYGKQPCYMTDFLMQFFMLSSFSWLNVLCFNLWRSIRKLQAINPKAKWKKRTFISYTLYGIGFPLFWSSLMFLTWKLKCVPESLLPKIGPYRCFFDRYPQAYDYYIYYKIPQFMLITTNVVLFVKIRSHCFEVKNNVRRVSENCKTFTTKIFKANKAKIAFVIKLSIFTGYTFLLDLFSQLTYLRGEPFLLYCGLLWDMTNYLSDSFMFFFLVLNKKTLSMLKQKLCCK